MKSKKFNSNNFIFRPTGMAAAMQSAGIGVKPFLVREEKIHGLLKAKTDKGNNLPSVSIHIIPHDSDVTGRKAA